MLSRDNLTDHFYQPTRGQSSSSEDDLELAYLLQHGEPGDEAVRSLLLERFAAQIHRLVDGWTTLVRGTSIPRSEVNQLVTDILATALSQIEQFRGEENVQNWIYRLAVKRLVKFQRWRLPLPKRRKISGEGIPDNLTSLTRQERVILWMRYGLDLDVLTCEKVLGRPHLKLKKVLKQARLKLLSEESLLIYEANQDFFLHLWDLSDGVLVENPEAVSTLERKLRGNPEYPQLVELHSVFEQTLSTELGDRWPIPELAAGEIQALNRNIISRSENHPIPILIPRWLKAGWTALFILVFIAAGLFWMDRSGNDQNQIDRSTPVVNNLPDVIPGGFPSDLEFQDSSVEVKVQFTAPDQSDDGDWIVYTVYEIQAGEVDSGEVDTTCQASVFLYHAATKTTQTIFESQPIPYIDGLLWINPPSISADGSWITFAAPGLLPNEDAVGCTTEAGLPCVDVYVYGRNTGETAVLTQAWNGEPTDGSSYAPVISGDGRIIAFWSSASNLIEGQVVECGTQELPGKCTFGYLYSMDTREITSLPVPGVRDASNLEPMSLSFDGHIVAFTTRITDEAIGSPRSQSFIYDSASGTIEDVNLAPNGAPGNGNVYTVAIDDSGRYVAFASDSTNLVPDDYNVFCDVFWLDRQTGTLIRVSMGIDGAQANADSGIFTSTIGLSSLDISPDGQHVVFLSLADNLVEDSGTCDPTGQELCNSLYYYDLQARTTELIAPQRSNGHDYFPMISGDGNWISYAGMRYDCPPFFYCADILRHDRQRGWNYNLTGSSSVIPGYSWFWAGSINLPGVETNAMAYSQDGAFLATANSDGKVRIFQMGDQSEYATLETGGSSSVISLDISPDNLWLAGGTAAGEVRIWKLDQKRLYFDLDNLPGRVIDIFFSEDSSQVFVVTAGEVSIWRLGNEVITRVQRIPLDGTRVLDTDLSPTGNLLASARQDGSVWMVLLSNGLILSRLYGGEAAVYDVLFSPDGTRLASRSVDGTVNVWEISWLGFGALDVQLLDSYRFPNWIGNLVFMADGSTLATILTDGGVGFWDIDNGQTYRISGSQFDHLAFVSHGDTLATASYGSIDFWNGPGLSAGKYFSHADMDVLADNGFASIDNAVDLRAAQWLSSQLISRDLYEADEELPYGLLAPAHLPERIIFQGSYLIESGGVLLHYSIDAGTGTPTALYILEQPIAGDFPRMWVGESAGVREIAMTGFLAEFVSGDWLPKVSSGTDSGESLWIWDGNSPSIRMRWQVNDLLIAMYFRAPDDGSAVLSQEDMLQIASGFQRVSQPPTEQTKLVEYTVQPGDTCTWIADTFSVDIGVIIQSNNLGDSCDIIFAGQRLLIPITYLTYTQEEVDLACDGTIERLDVIKMSDLLSGVRVLVKNDAGFYVHAWEWILEDTGMNRLESIQVLKTGDCISLLVARVMNDYQPSWAVFSWDGMTMQPYEIDPVELERLLRP